MSDLGFGKLITGTRHRDAVHVAVAPVVASESLIPAQRIGLVDPDNDKELVSGRAASIGIVDPYLSQPVHKGDKFWMFLFPNTVTSLRHEWEHPCFTTPTSRQEAEERLREMCNEDYNLPSYDRLVASADDEYNLDNGYFLIRGADANGRVPDGMYDLLEIILGKKLENRPNHFSCSC